MHLALGPRPTLQCFLRICFNLMDSSAFMESTTVKFEWTVRGLAELFESRYVRVGGHVHDVRAIVIAI